jgi:hypothetical protein
MMVFKPRFIFGDEREALFAAVAKPATPSTAIGGAQ